MYVSGWGPCKDVCTRVGGHALGSPVGEGVGWCRSCRRGWKGVSGQHPQREKTCQPRVTPPQPQEPDTRLADSPAAAPPQTPEVDGPSRQVPPKIRKGAWEKETKLLKLIPKPRLGHQEGPIFIYKSCIGREGVWGSPRDQGIVPDPTRRGQTLRSGECTPSPVTASTGTISINPESSILN